MSIIVTMAANENINVDNGDDIIQLLQQEGQVREREQQEEGEQDEEKKDKAKPVVVEEEKTEWVSE